MYCKVILPDETNETTTETINESTAETTTSETIPSPDIINPFWTVDIESLEYLIETTYTAEIESTTKESCETEMQSKNDVKETETESVSEVETDVEKSTSSESEIESETERNMTYLGKYKITGYSTKSCCNGSGNAGKTASGEPLTPWYSVAMKGIPFGTKIYIDGLGEFVVHDRGVGKGKVDVCVNTCGHMEGGSSEAYQITGRYDVYIIE